MRYSDIIDEALNVFKVHGDKMNAGTFRDGDLKATRSEVWNQKVRSYFSRTPFDFNIHLWNITQDAKRPKVMPVAGAITFVTSDNEGADRIGLTPWILAHRLAHGILGDGSGSAVRDFTSSAAQIVNILGRQNDAYGFKSGRNGVEFLREGELVVDMLTQYIVQGSIKFDFDRDDAEKMALHVSNVNKHAHDMLSRFVGKVVYLGAGVDPTRIANEYSRSNKNFRDDFIQLLIKVKTTQEVDELIDEILLPFEGEVEYPPKRLAAMRRKMVTFGYRYIRNLTAQGEPKTEKPEVEPVFDPITADNLELVSGLPKMAEGSSIVEWLEQLDDGQKAEANDIYKSIRDKYQPKNTSHNTVPLYPKMHVFTRVKNQADPVFVPKRGIATIHDMSFAKLQARADELAEKDTQYRGLSNPVRFQKMAQNDAEFKKLAIDQKIVAVESGEGIAILLPHYTSKKLKRNPFGFDQFAELLRAR